MNLFMSGEFVPVNTRNDPRTDPEPKQEKSKVEVTTSSISFVTAGLFLWKRKSNRWPKWRILLWSPSFSEEDAHGDYSLVCPDGPPFGVTTMPVVDGRHALLCVNVIVRMSAFVCVCVCARARVRACVWVFWRRDIEGRDLFFPAFYHGIRREWLRLYWVHVRLRMYFRWRFIHVTLSPPFLALCPNTLVAEARVQASL